MGEVDWERWNTHFSTTVQQEVLGFTFRLSQDPNSEHLGTTVWDSSIVFSKYIEKHVFKGDFSRKKAQGKRAVELGAGMGLAGMAFALLGCKEVVLTDVQEVLPLLRKNADTNLSPTALRGTQAEPLVGHVRVQELDWKQREHCAAAKPPFDFVIATDCIYHEHHLPDLLETMLCLTDAKSKVIIVNELRCQSVHEKFLMMFGGAFTMKKVPHSQMHSVYQHASVDIFILKRRMKTTGHCSDEPGSDEAGQCKTMRGGGDGDHSPNPLDEKNPKVAAGGDVHAADCEIGEAERQWQTRRQGVMAARLLKDLKPDGQ